MTATEEEVKLSAMAERFCRRFSLAEIQLATGDFSEAHVIGKGGFGKVYKGQIDDGQQTVAMKRLAPTSNQGEGEFLTEIETLSKLRHVNLVSLIGYCDEKGEMILVYEYIPRGTLADHRTSLTWKQRLNICIGAARGLDYLHTGTSIIHRDVKSTNVLLDENFTAKVSDFGLAKHLSSSNSDSHVSTLVKGSFGYLDPSYFTTGRLTRKSDTYAFGVVLLEVLSARPVVDPTLADYGGRLVIWALAKIIKGKVDQIIASNLKDEISTDCLKTFLGIAKRCLNHEPRKRPTMAQVVVQLEFALEKQDRKAPIFNASRFLPFLNRVKPSASRATGPSTTIPTQEDTLTADVLPNAVTAISIHELTEITNMFSSKCLISQEYNVSVYRGALKSGQIAAIKKLPYSSCQAEEYLEQVSMKFNLKHENVAQLLGYCVDDPWQFLVYEFSHGSLHDILHASSGSDIGKQEFNGWEPVPTLSWAQRVKIATGAAKGLKYIHDKGLIHFNIRSNNILVCDDDIAKLANFDQSTKYTYSDYHPSTFGKPRGYQSPEYIRNGELSWKSDVYSFGVVLLELLTGGKLVDHLRPRGQQHIVQWVTPWLSGDKVKEIVDARLNGDYPPKAVVKMAVLAALCVQHEAKIRPNMSFVVTALCALLNDC